MGEAAMNVELKLIPPVLLQKSQGPRLPKALILMWQILETQLLSTVREETTCFVTEGHQN